MRLKGKNRRTLKLWKSGCLIVVVMGVLIIGWGSFNFLRGLVVTSLLKVDLLKWQEVKESAFWEGILIKEETVVRAPIGGDFKALVEEGWRLSANTSVAIIKVKELESKEKEIIIKSPRAGIFSIQIDGLENILSPSQLGKLDLSNVKNENPKPSPGQVVLKGEPVFKIIDNLSPIFCYFELSEESLNQEPIKGSSLSLLWNNYFFKAKINEVRTTNNKVNVLLEMTNYPESLLYNRKTKFKVITKSISGLIIQKKSLVQRDGQKGIYVLFKERIKWVPVIVIDQIDDKIAIEGEGLAVGTPYIVNPFWLGGG